MVHRCGWKIQRAKYLSRHPHLKGTPFTYSRNFRAWLQRIREERPTLHNPTDYIPSPQSETSPSGDLQIPIPATTAPDSSPIGENRSGIAPEPETPPSGDLEPSIPAPIAPDSSPIGENHSEGALDPETSPPSNSQIHSPEIIDISSDSDTEEPPNIYQIHLAPASNQTQLLIETTSHLRDIDFIEIISTTNPSRHICLPIQVLRSRVSVCKITEVGV